MTYIKLDDDFHMHRKVMGLSDGAYRLYIGMLCYSSSQLTDGFVPAAAMPAIAPRSWRKLTAELKDSCLIDPDEDGYMIHDYLKHQRSREEVLRLRAAARDRAQRGRSSQEVRANVEQSSAVRAAATETATEDIHPPAPVRAGARRWYEQTVGRSARNPVLAQMLSDLDAAHPSECVEAVFKKSAAASEPWPYAKRIFDSCLLEGHEPKVRNGTYKPGTHGRNGRGATQSTGADRERSRPLTEAERIVALAEIERVDQEIRASGAAAGAVE